MEYNPIPPPAEERLSAEDRKLLQCFYKLLRLFRRTQNEILRPYGLGKVHALYLLYLYDNPQGARMTEVTRALGMDKANTTRVLRDLEAKGYLAKQRESERKTTVSLTPQGRDIASLCVRTARLWREEFLRLMSPEEGAELVRLLLTFSDLMERQPL